MNDELENEYQAGYAAGKQHGMEGQWLGLAALRILHEHNIFPSSTELIEAYNRCKQIVAKNNTIGFYNEFFTSPW